MASIKLSAAVGNPKVRSKPPIKNKPADVLLIRQMINANRSRPLKMSDKMDKDLMATIAIVSRKRGETPISVIDPGDDTFKKLLPKYEALIKKIGKQDYVKFTSKGKTYWVTKEDFIRNKKKIVSHLEKIAIIYRDQYDHYDAIIQDYAKVAMMQEGFTKAFVHMVTIRTGNVKRPSDKLLADTGTALVNFEKAVKGAKSVVSSVRGNRLDAVEAAMLKVEPLLKKLVADVMRFLKDFCGSAGKAAKVASITSTVAFGVVGAMAGPALIAGTAMTSAATSAVLAGGGVSVLNSASNEFGKYTSGEKMSLTGSLKTIAIDGTVGMLTAGIGNKLPVKFLDEAAEQLAAKAAKQTAGMTKEYAKVLVKRYMVEGGKEAVKEAAAQTVKLIGESAKSGKSPKASDIMNAFCEVAFKGMSAGMLKDWGKFTKVWSHSNNSIVPAKLLGDALSKAHKGVPIGKILRGKILNEVSNKISEDVAKVGFDAVMDEAKGSETAASLLAIAKRGVANNSTLRTKAEKATKEVLKKHKAEIAKGA